MRKTESYLIALTIFLIFSCNNVSKQDQYTNQSLLEGEWTDGSGDFSIIYPFRVFDTGKIMAFDTFISVHQINDSLYNIHYPKEPMILDAKLDSYLDIENVIGDSGKNYEWIDFGLQSNNYDSRTNEIIFGADRLKFFRKKNNKIKVYFPSKSLWKVRKTNEGIDIFNNINSKSYRRFVG